ncbi:MAG: restriction endonuclease subunit S [Culicoidibacterales bacterium]
MNAKQLKNSLLQLAIQGHLVEQRAEEGTAQTLIEQIQAEKEQLIKDKKIKKQKPLPAITEDEIPFEIPKNWEWVRLGVVGDWGAGATPSRAKSEYYGGDIPWLKTGDLTDGYVYKVSENISEEAVQKTSVKLNPIGSVLMAMYGATIGKLGILKIEATTNQACCACIPFRGINNKYLFYYLLSERKNFISLGSGGAQPNISKEKIVNYIMPLPPIEEQKRIVAKIEELEPYIEKYGENYEMLESLNKKFPQDMQKSILQYAIQGRLVEQRVEEGTAQTLIEQIQAEKEQLIKEKKIKKQKPLPAITEDEIPFEIPESWEWVRLGEVFNIVSSKRVHKSDWKSSGIPFYRAREIGKLAESGFVDNDLYIDEILFEKFAEISIPKAGDLMVTAVGTLGKTYIVKETDKFYYKDASVICFEKFSMISSAYVKQIMSSDFMIRQIKNNSAGTTVDTLTISRANNYILPLPPIEEQKRIVAKIEELLPMCKHLSK